MNLYDRAEIITRNRVFYLLYILIPAILPPLTAKGLAYLRKLPEFSMHVAYTLFDYKAAYAHWMPALHGILLLILFLLLIFRKKFGRIFALLVALNFAISILTQTTVVTQRYGRVVLTEIFLWYSMVVICWIWEAIIQKTDYNFRGGHRPWWLLPLALIAFWNPDEAWNLSLSFFIHGFSPVAFCMLVPIYLTVLLFTVPNVNLPLLRIQSFTGLIIGFISVFISIIQTPSEGLYWILLHAPLLVISFYAFKTGLRLRPSSE